MRSHDSTEYGILSELQVSRQPFPPKTYPLDGYQLVTGVMYGSWVFGKTGRARARTRRPTGHWERGDIGSCMWILDSAGV